MRHRVRNAKCQFPPRAIIFLELFSAPSTLAGRCCRGSPPPPVIDSCVVQCYTCPTLFVRSETALHTWTHCTPIPYLGYNRRRVQAFSAGHARDECIQMWHWITKKERIYDPQILKKKKSFLPNNTKLSWAICFHWRTICRFIVNN